MSLAYLALAFVSFIAAVLMLDAQDAVDESTTLSPRAALFLRLLFGVVLFAAMLLAAFFLAAALA